MRRSATALAIALPLFASCAYGQLDPYTLTVVASRPMVVQPDQASISVTLNVDPSLGLSDVLSMVQGVGLTQSNLSNSSITYLYSSVAPYSQYSANAWTFTEAVPFASLKTTLANLAALVAKISKPNSLPTMTFFVTGVQTSPQLLATQTCPTAALVADATAQAQALAQAAGLGLGQISTITDGGGSGSTGTVGAARLSVASYANIGQPIGGTFVQLTGGLLTSTLYSYSSTPVSSCTIVVKFKLTLS